ncbi:MAG TPA: hypothetical protein VJZ49_15575 [Syntrophales bacterium]|nr:hypothetical protein [Syntrophales bacterium]
MRNDLLLILSPSDVMQAAQEKEAASQEAEQPSEHFVSALSQHIIPKWQAAQQAKIIPEMEMLASVRQKRGEYDPQKLAEIQNVGQPEIFMNVTDTKVRNGVAWIKDIIIQPTQRIIAVDPTPLPDLPQDIKEQITSSVVRQYLDMAVSQAAQTGQQISSDQLRAWMQQESDAVGDRVHSEIVKKAKAMAEDITDQIDDHFKEGGFYKALNQCIDDIVGLKAGFIKGPTFRKERLKKTSQDPATGKLVRNIETKIVPQYDRVSPFAVFPSPRSTTVDNGYLFLVGSIRPHQLHELIGVPGYDEAEIREVLKEFQEKKLNDEWLTLSLEAKEGIGEENPDQPWSAPENIPYLELWDELPGKLLLEWGMTAEDIPDPDDDYAVCVWQIGTHVIKAMLNYDSLGKKPISKISFENDNDSFWGRGVAEMIADCQQVCNACARSILANIAMGALPMVDLNIDRLEPGASRKIWPGRVFPTTDEQMASGSKAVNFYQPQMVTQQLQAVYDAFSRIADEHSGIPAYAHGGDVGAGGNASGLAQLIGMATRGIKAVIRNIDLDGIVPCLERHYDYLLENFEIYGLMGDYKVSAKGTAALLAKEQQTARKNEFLNYTANPVDIQIIGTENRRKILFSVAKDLGIDIDENILPPIPQGGPTQPQPGTPLPGMVSSPPAPSPQTLDAAGNPAQGVDDRQFNESRPRMEVSSPGQAGGAEGYQ